MKPKIHLIYIDSGGGHRAAATALSAVIQEQERPWEVEMISIQDLLDPIDYIRKYTGVQFQDVYNIMLRRGWTAGTAQLIPVMHGLIRLSHNRQVETLVRYWTQHRPDMVVSLIPHYNRALKDGLEMAWPGTPFVTVLTDIADYPPHFWIERQEQHVICGSDMAVRQAIGQGIPPERVLRTSGMILHPRFYDRLRIDRRLERMRRGLRADRPTALVLFGGEGSREMIRVARALNREDSGVQLIFLCGKNEALAGDLRAMPQRTPMFVQGFTRDVPLYMGISDFFIGKPGPGSISEALSAGLPVIVQRNAWTMAHERYNADWVEEIGVGLVVRDFAKELPGAIASLLAPGNLEAIRSRVAAIENRAVYEIPGLLAGILNQASESSPSGMQLPLAMPPR
ncbi:MAG: glycosyltransferase [Candidatus Solibacter sp.]